MAELVLCADGQCLGHTSVGYVFGVEVTGGGKALDEGSEVRGEGELFITVDVEPRHPWFPVSAGCPVVERNPVVPAA